MAEPVSQVKIPKLEGWLKICMYGSLLAVTTTENHLHKKQLHHFPKCTSARWHQVGLGLSQKKNVGVLKRAPSSSPAHP